MMTAFVQPSVNAGSKDCKKQRIMTNSLALAAKRFSGVIYCYIPEKFVIFVSTIISCEVIF